MLYFFMEIEFRRDKLCPPRLFSFPCGCTTVISFPWEKQSPRACRARGEVGQGCWDEALGTRAGHHTSSWNGLFSQTTTHPFHQQQAMMEALCELSQIHPGWADPASSPWRSCALHSHQRCAVLAGLCALCLIPWHVSWWPEVGDGSQ